MRKLNILLTNDDGYKAKGIKILSEILSDYGKIIVIAPKIHQSGMSMAVDLGLKRLAYKVIDNNSDIFWAYLDGRPASCVKFGLNFQFRENKPDIIMSGINHGSNASMGSCYSGTLGAVQEAAINGVLGIGVSLDNYSLNADFDVVKRFLPEVLDKILGLNYIKGIYYNINFPDVPINEVKGIKIAKQGRGHWEKEFTKWDGNRHLDKGMTPENMGIEHKEIEEGEEIYMMVGEFIDDSHDDMDDHILLKRGYITIVPHNIYNTDENERQRLIKVGLEKDF